MSILAYHMVDTRFDFGVTRVTPKQFEKQVILALENGFKFQVLSEYLKSDPSDDKRVAFTFDDGYESVYTWAFPVLHHYGLPATVFVNPGYAGALNTWDVNIGWLKFRQLSWPQIHELDEAGWEVGSHTMSHRDLTRISETAARTELQESRDIIREQVEHFCPYICYPFGNTNRQIIDLCRQMGYEGGVVMGRHENGLDAAYIISRIGIYLLDTKWTFGQKLKSRHTDIFYKIQDFINICSNCTVLVKKGSWNK